MIIQKSAPIFYDPLRRNMDETLIFS